MGSSLDRSWSLWLGMPRARQSGNHREEVLRLHSPLILSSLAIAHGRTNSKPDRARRGLLTLCMKVSLEPRAEQGAVQSGVREAEDKYPTNTWKLNYTVLYYIFVLFFFLILLS